MADLGTIGIGNFDSSSPANVLTQGSDPLLEVIASADDNDYVYVWVNSTLLTSSYFDLNAVPADFDSMDSVSARVRFVASAVDTDKLWNGIACQVRTQPTGGSNLTDLVWVAGDGVSTTDIQSN